MDKQELDDLINQDSLYNYMMCVKAMSVGTDLDWLVNQWRDDGALPCPYYSIDTTVAMSLVAPMIDGRDDLIFKILGPTPNGWFVGLNCVSEGYWSQEEAAYGETVAHAMCLVFVQWAAHKWWRARRQQHEGGDLPNDPNSIPPPPGIHQPT